MRALLLLAAAAPVLLSAPPNLEVSFRAESGATSVVLKNVNSVPAVAYNCVVETQGAGKHKPKPTSEWMSFDALFDRAGEVTIAPQGERAIPAKSVRPRATPRARIAVLYADGSTSGEPDDVRRLLDVRQASLADMPHVRMLIRSSADAGALRLELEKLRKRNLKPPAPALKHGTPRQRKLEAKEIVRLHYAGSRLPAVVLRWMDESVDKGELMARLDALESQILKSPK